MQCGDLLRAISLGGKLTTDMSATEIKTAMSFEGLESEGDPGVLPRSWGCCDLAGGYTDFSFQTFIHLYTFMSSCRFFFFFAWL